MRRSPGEGSVYRRPDGRWCGQVVVGHTASGNAKRRTVYAKTKTALIQRLQTAQHEADRGPVDRRSTLAQLVTRWLATKEPDVRPTTYDSYKRALTKHSGVLWRMRVVQITTQAIEDHLDHLRDTKAGGRIVPYYRRVLRSVFRYAVSCGVVPVSPAAGTKPRPHQRDIPRVWEPAEVEAFLSAATGERLYALFHLALATAMRIGELLGLQWAYVDLDGATLRVRWSRTRGPNGPHLTEPKTTRARRSIALDAETVGVLRARQQQRDDERALAEQYGFWKGGDYVFSFSDGRPVSPSWVGVEFARIADAAGVHRIRVHDLRHTSATLSLRAGVPVQVVSERLCHRKASFTMDEYVDVLPVQNLEAALPLDTLLARDAARKQHSKKTN